MKKADLEDAKITAIKALGFLFLTTKWVDSLSLRAINLPDYLVRITITSVQISTAY